MALGRLPLVAGKMVSVPVGVIRPILSAAEVNHRLPSAPVTMKKGEMALPTENSVMLLVQTDEAVEEEV